MFYIIGDTTVSTDPLSAFSIEPTLDVTYSFTYTVGFVSGPTPTASTLQVISNTDIQVGVETSTDMFGSYTARLTGTLDDADSTAVYEDFTLNLIKLEGSISDQTYRIQASGTAKTVTFSAVTHNPTGGNIPAYTFAYSLIGWDGSTESAADSGIFTAVSGMTFDIATASTSAATDYALAIKAIVD